jgi:hypothetical protein
MKKQAKQISKTQMLAAGELQHVLGGETTAPKTTTTTKPVVYLEVKLVDCIITSAP